MSTDFAENVPRTFDGDSTAFLRWFSTFDDTRLSRKLELVDYRQHGAGRGVVAVSDIESDEELFAIPHAVVLSMHNSDLQQHVTDSLESFGPWMSLIVVLIYEYLRKEKSPWSAYFRVLPTTFNTLMFWNSAEIAELQGSAVVTKIGKEEAEESWRNTIIPFMQEHSELFPVTTSECSGCTTHTATQAEDQLIKLSHMAGSLIMAYAFDLGSQHKSETEDSEQDGFVADDEEDPLKGMVPLADMLNADADRNNARLFDEENHLVMKATKPIQAGAEIFNDYGPLPRSDLLRMYGYITKDYDRYDVVEVTFNLIESVAAASTPSQPRKVQDALDALNELGLLQDGYTISRPTSGAQLDDVVPGDFHMLLTAFSSESNIAIEPRTINTSRPSGWGFSETSLLSAVLTKRLTEYKTTLHEDKNILFQLQNGDLSTVPPAISSTRYEMAVQVRKGEKEILHQVLQIVRDVVAANTNGISTGSTKRKKHDQDAIPRKAPKLAGE